MDRNKNQQRNQILKSTYLASDRGLGLVAGSRAACDMALWVADSCHAFRDLFEGLHHVARQADAAMDQADEAARTFARATSEATLAQRLQHDDTAHHTCEQALALYDHRALRLPWWREAFHGCSPQGRLRTPEDVRPELTRLFHRIAALDSAAIPNTLKPLPPPIAAMFVPCKHAATMDAALRAVVPHAVWDFLGLAWPHAPGSSPSPAKPTPDHQHERAFGLACAAELLGDEFDTLTTLGFDTLDTIVRASSRVEMVHGLLRPSGHRCKGQLTQEALTLILFSHKHHRDQSGKRPGKAPIALLTGTPWEAPW